MSATLASALFLGLVLQEPRPTRQTIDPYLADNLRAVVQQAAEAERDPRRGPGNAMTILKGAREKLVDPSQQLALDLRLAGVALRNRFLQDKKFPEPVRWEQVLSTFARLDLSEPLLKPWLDDAIAHHPLAQQNLKKKGARTLKLGLLLRGDSLNKLTAQKALAAPIEALGFDVEWVPLKDARWIVKLAAEDARADKPDLRAARVLIGLEHLEDGKLAWSHSLFRTEQAKDPGVALEAALQWIARIGGRDLFFHWLAEHGLGGLKDAAGTAEPGAGGHEGHEH